MKLWLNVKMFIINFLKESLRESNVKSNSKQQFQDKVIIKILTLNMLYLLRQMWRVTFEVATLRLEL